METVTTYDGYLALGWRDGEKPLKALVFVHDISGATQAEDLHNTLIECYHYVILLNCCLQ